MSGCAYGLTKEEQITSHGTGGSRDAGAVAVADDDDDDSVAITDDGDAEGDATAEGAARDAAVAGPDPDAGAAHDAGAPMMDAALPPPDGGGDVVVDAGDQSVRIAGVTLKTVPGSRYVGESSGLVVATATSPAAPQLLTLRDLNGGTLEGGDTVTVQAASGGLFQATNGGGSTLLIAMDHPEWQTLRVVRKAGAGRVVNGEIVGLQTLATGRWVSAENGGGGPVFVYGHSLGMWEELVITGLP